MNSAVVAEDQVDDGDWWPGGRQWYNVQETICLP